LRRVTQPPNIAGPLCLRGANNTDLSIQIILYPMIFDRFIKTYEIQTSKSISEITDEINYRRERQQGKKLLLMTETVNYSNAIIDKDSVKFKRTSVVNRLKGNGIITFQLESSFHGTKIICTVDPTLMYILKNLGFIAALLIYLTYIFFRNARELHFNTFIFIGVIWIFILSIGYFTLFFNTKTLESYSKTILYDLGLMTPNEGK
jgi:hypothetical protein